MAAPVRMQPSLFSLACLRQQLFCLGVTLLGSSVVTTESRAAGAWLSDCFYAWMKATLWRFLDEAGSVLCFAKRQIRALLIML